MLVLYEEISKYDFDRARFISSFSSVLAKLKGEGDKLLSFYDVKKLLGPYKEVYSGMQHVPIAKIVGSEGRYKDFNVKFLPKREFLRSRWQNINIAHYKNVILPPVKLYQVGDVYFVRDGNHRVSVAKSQGIEFVDAEVVYLKTKINIMPGMDINEIKTKVIEFEKERFLKKTNLNSMRDNVQLDFTAIGRYDALLQHIAGHQYYLGLAKKREILFTDAILSWYDNVYIPIVTEIRNTKILKTFTNRTESDLYVWIVKHWDLSKKKNKNTKISDAILDFIKKYGKRKSKKSNMNKFFKFFINPDKKNKKG